MRQVCIYGGRGGGGLLWCWPSWQPRALSTSCIPVGQSSCSWRLWFDKSDQALLQQLAARTLKMVGVNDLPPVATLLLLQQQHTSCTEVSSRACKHQGPHMLLLLPPAKHRDAFMHTRSKTLMQ